MKKVDSRTVSMFVRMIRKEGVVVDLKKKIIFIDKPIVCKTTIERVIVLKKRMKFKEFEQLRLF